MKQCQSHANGAPVADDFNIQTIGPRGPALLQDAWMLEMLANFIREDIPEQRMQAKGAGAYGLWPDGQQAAEPELELRGSATRREHRIEEDDYSQVTALFNLMNSEERQRLFDNTARAMHGASPEVQCRHVENCCRVDPIYGAGVAMALGLI